MQLSPGAGPGLCLSLRPEAGPELTHLLETGPTLRPSQSESHSPGLDPSPCTAPGTRLHRRVLCQVRFPAWLQTQVLVLVAFSDGVPILFLIRVSLTNHNV